MNTHAKITKWKGSEDKKKKTGATKNFFTVLFDFLMLPSIHWCWQYPDHERYLNRDDSILPFDEQRSI